MLRGVVAVATISVSAACSPGKGPAEAGRAAAPAAPWTTLFDGTSLAAWTTTGDANWQLSDGIVAADMGAGFLVTREQYGDFELEVEFFVSADANSGVLLRCANPAKPGAAARPASAGPLPGEQAADTLIVATATTPRSMSSIAPLADDSTAIFAREGRNTSRESAGA